MVWRGHGRFVTRLSCIATVLLIGAPLCGGQATGKQPPSSPRQTTLKEVLSWLPGDTETIIGANGPFLLPNRDASGDNDSEQAKLRPAQLELQMHALPLGLFSLKNGDLQKSLKGKRVVLAVEGSRHFRPPAELGQMRYEGCEIAVFSLAVTIDPNAFMKNATGSATRFEEIAGVKIAVFEESQEDDVWATFVAFPRSNIVLVATNADYLRGVLARMGGASGARALPETLPEWKYVNTGAPAWGLRHYQRREAGLDPSSPFSGEAEANFPDNLAVGLAFWFEAAVQRTATVAYLSGNKNSRQILQDYLSLADAKSASPREFQIRLRQAAPGVIEGSVALSLGGALGRFLLGLIAMLGHAVYL